MKTTEVTKKIKNTGSTLLAVVVAVAVMVAVSVSPVITVRAVDCTSNPTANGCPCSPGVMSSSNSAICRGQELDPSQHGSDLTKTAKNYINAALYVIGMLAVAMVVYSGLRYITAHGNKTQVESAKNILIYSVVGLVVSILAYAIVNFVLSRF